MPTWADPVSRDIDRRRRPGRPARVHPDGGLLTGSCRSLLLLAARGVDPDLMRRRRSGLGVSGRSLPADSRQGRPVDDKRRTQPIEDFNTQTNLRQLMHFYGLT
jgi:hypothetical protein